MSQGCSSALCSLGFLHLGSENGMEFLEGWDDFGLGVKQWDVGAAMCRADPGHAQPAAQQGQPWGSPHQGLHCPPVGLEMSTAWDRLSHIQAAGRRLKHRHRHRARQREVTVSEPLGCQLAGTKVMLTATAGARVLPIKQGRAQICQQTAGSKRHFFLYPDAFKCL